MKKRWDAFYNAFYGILCTAKVEAHVKFHWLATILIIIAGLWFSVSLIEWCLLLICIGIVISLEMLNSSVEKICDMVHPEYHEKVKYIKDVAAGAVLLFSIVAAIIGLIVFLPYVATLLN